MTVIAKQREFIVVFLILSFNHGQKCVVWRDAIAEEVFLGWVQVFGRGTQLCGGAALCRSFLSVPVSRLSVLATGENAMLT